jgi:NADH:ubiquinone oxidoreductase subunit K
MKKVFKSLIITGYIAVCSMLMFGVTANAYIDPSVMTYLIQAVAGAVIAIGAAIGIYWHRAKKKVYKKLNIDENRNKEVESDDIEIK